MVTEEKKSYPMMALKNWFLLRKKFKTTIPREITTNYLSSTLGMSIISAQKNIMPYLRLTGLIDLDGKTTERAIKWRDDNQYTEVCESIRNEIYPQELLDLAPPNDIDRNTIQTWFANNTGSGESQAGKQSAFYIMLCESNLKKDTDSNSLPVKTKVKKTNVTKKPGERKSIPVEDEEYHPETTLSVEPIKKPTGNSEIVPQFHFNIQIVLPENSSKDTYDHIFKSIATYLLNRGEN